MKKIKKLSKFAVKNKYAIIVVSLVLMVAGFGIKAQSGSFWDRVAQVAGQIIGTNLIDKLESSGILDGEFGAMPGPGLSEPCFTVNHDTTCREYSKFINSSTTIVSFYSPFLISTSSATDVVVNGRSTVASSTVDLIRLDVTVAATSTFTVICGASATPYAAATIALLSSGSVATSSTVTIENNVTAAQGASVDGGTVAKIMLGPKYPYLVCTVTTSYAGAFTEVTNTFDGTYMVRISKTE